MNMSSVKKDKNLLSRRGFLNGAIAGTGTIILSDRLAIAQNMLMGSSELSINDVQGWGEKPGFVNIGMNENPHGPSPMAIRAVADNLMDANRYDFSSPMKLNTSIGEYHGLPKVERETTWWGPSSFYPVYCEGGSSFILRQIAVHHGIRNGVGEIIEAIPAYGAISREINNYSRRVGAEVNIKRIETTKDFKHDLGKMLDAVTSETTLIVITNPNNPTGKVLDPNKLREFCIKASKKTLVLVDEAYNELIDEPPKHSMIPLVKAGHNVIVARTFSKIYGLAGMRVGYLIASEENTEWINRYGMGGYTLNQAGLAAAIASYNDDAFLTFSKEKIYEGKSMVMDAVKANGLTALPSSTNFIFVNLGDGNAEYFRQAMAEQDVLIRGIYRTYDNWSRVSMGKIGDVKRYVDAMPSALEKMYTMQNT
mgnify:CR=1 FL=1